MARKRGKNTTLLSSMSLTGMGPSMVVEGGANGVVFETYMEAELQVGMSFAHADGTEVRPKRRCAPMKVLIGVDPHKGSVAVAAVDEAKGELLERASFPQNRAGLRALERWA